MSETETNQSQCPSPDELSAYCDQQLDDPAIAAHVEGCANCKSIMKSYERINHKIQENLKQPTQRDMGILVRIKDESMREIKQSKPPLLGRGAYLKIFLSVVIIAGLFYMINYFRDYGTKPQLGQAEQPDLPKEDPNGDQGLPTTTEDDAELLKLASEHAEDFNDVQLLAFGTFEEQLRPIIGKKSIPDVKVRETIERTWKVRDPAGPALFLKTLLGPDYRESFEQLMVEAGDRAIAVLLLPKNKVAKLEGLLQQLNYKAVGEPTADSNDDALVRYELSFLRDDLL